MNTIIYKTSLEYLTPDQKMLAHITTPPDTKPHPQKLSGIPRYPLHFL